MASTQEGGEKPLNASEKAYLKDNFGDEFHFLRDHGLNIYKEEHRSEGRAILRAFQKNDCLPEEDHCKSGANKVAPELCQDNHFRADNRAEEAQYHQQTPRGFDPAHGFDSAGRSIDGPAQDPALFSASGGGEQHQGQAREYDMNPHEFGYNHEQSGAFDGGYQDGRQNGYHGGRDDGYVGGYSFWQRNGWDNPFEGGPYCHHGFLDECRDWYVEEFGPGHDGCDNLHDAGYDDGYDYGHDDGYDYGYDDVYDVEYSYRYQDDD
ncbi:hypothetical protein V2G26_004626 [Clonostachys chloroleuca]